MQREIKFRAWDKNKSVFIPTEYWAVISTSFKAFGVMLKDWEDYREGEYFFEHAQILTEFTGLHDRNGVEIYEGDILQDSLTKMVYVVKNGRCIKYAFNGWYVENEDLGYVTSINGDYDTNKNSQIEVIGNIHQNPELLNATT